MTEISMTLDFGSGVTGQWYSWDPDLDPNPQYRDLADQLPIDRAGLILRHPRPDNGEPCESGITFDLPAMPNTGQPRWQVEQWEPLTLSPSISCVPGKGGCGLHGYIREGLWVPA